MALKLAFYLKSTVHKVLYTLNKNFYTERDLIRHSWKLASRAGIMSEVTPTTGVRDLTRA